jgi:DNA-binding response OmpR family regulator
MRLGPEHAPVPAPRIIALDDSRTVLATVRSAFERLGCEVLTAEDPSELAPGEFQRAALIVVDVQMVHMYGDDIVQFLRDQWRVEAPIYLYSSLPKQELERRAAAAGANGAVCKAEGIDALVARVKHLAVGT